MYTRSFNGEEQPKNLDKKSKLPFTTSPCTTAMTSFFFSKTMKANNT